MNSLNNSSAWVCRTLFVFLLLCASGCDDESTAPTPSSSSPTGQPVQVPPAAGNRDGSNSTLATSPIDLSTAYSSRVVAVAATPICPWLSDADARASVDGIVAGKTLQRRRVADGVCQWSVNAGFSLTIQRTPLVSAKALSQVQYNMDTAPVLESIDGPGANTMLLKDPTWDKANPRLFGMGFDLGQERILILVVGLRTSVDQMRQLGQKIADSEPGSIAAPEPAVSSQGPSLNPCVFDPAVLTSILEGRPGESLRTKPDVGGSICEYRGTLRQGRYRVTLGLQFSGDILTEQMLGRDNYEPANDFGENVYWINRDELEGPSHSSRGYRIANPNGNIEMNLMVSDPEFPEKVAKLLIENLQVRTRIDE